MESNAYIAMTIEIPSNVIRKDQTDSTLNQINLCLYSEMEHNWVLMRTISWNSVIL